MKYRITLGLVGMATALGLSFAAQKFLDEKGHNPDRPPGAREPADEGDYIEARQKFIAMLRGNDPKKPIDPNARSRAVALMDLQMKALQKKVALSKNTDAPLAIPTWVALGPNPIPNGQTQTVSTAVSGRVTAIEVDPSDANKVYVGTAQGGVYRSLDGGVNWTPIFDSAISLAIGALNLDAANGWLWVGTGEANGSGDSYAGVGLYRIENVSSTATLVGPINPIRNYIDFDGITPRSTGFFSGRSISKIVPVPGDPSTLFVGIAGGVIGLGSNAPFGGAIPPLAMRGMAKLSNVNGPAAGITGTRLAVSTTPLNATLCFDTPCTVNRSVNDIVLDPQDASGNTMLVWLNGTNVAGDGGIYRSSNAMGANPSFIQTLITTATTTGNGRGEIRAYARAGTSVIYAASGEPSTGTICNSATNFGALRRSDDGGLSWSAKLQGGGGFCAGQCFYNIAFAVVPGAATAADKLMLAGNVRSTICAKLQGTSIDGGATTFTNTDVGLHADTHFLKIAPSDGNVVYRGDDGGIWKSLDAGATWLSLNNTSFIATQFQSIALHPSDATFSMGGTQDNGTEKLTTGPTWIRSDAGDGGFVLIDQNATDIINVRMYHTYFNQTGTQIGYVTSTNAGISWPTSSICSGGITCTDATNFYAPMTLGPGAPNTLYFGSDRLYRSSDGGATNVLVSQAPLVSTVPISSVAVAALDDNYRFVGNNNGALWFTTTGSTTLTSLDPVGAGSVIPDFYVARIVFDPADKNSAYISLGNYAGNTNPAGSHLWKANNLNTTPVLTAINGSGANVLPDVPINALATTRVGSTVIYAGTDIGVFVTLDGGLNWSPYGQGLPRVAVFDMAVQKLTGTLRIATHGRGMWELADQNNFFKDGFE